MTNQAQWYTGQRVNVAGHDVTGTIISIGDQDGRPDKAGKLLIHFKTEDTGKKSHSHWYPVEKVTANEAARRSDQVLRDEFESGLGLVPSGGGGGGYTDNSCPQCASRHVVFMGMDSDPIDGLMELYRCVSCGSTWAESDEPSDDDDTDEIGGGGGVLSARERYAMTWRYARLLELLEKANADANYEYATTFCSNCPGSDGDCCKHRNDDEAWEFFAGGSIQRAHDLTKRMNELIPDRTVIDRSILGECRRLLQIRNQYPVPLVNRPLLWQLYRWHCKARAYGVTGISGRAFLESYYGNGWNEKLALDALLAAGGGGGGDYAPVTNVYHQKPKAVVTCLECGHPLDWVWSAPAFRPFDGVWLLICNYIESGGTIHFHHRTCGLMGHPFRLEHYTPENALQALEQKKAFYLRVRRDPSDVAEFAAWWESMHMPSMLTGGGGGGYETEFMTVRQAWIHDESVLAAADMDIEQTLRDGWKLHQITYVAHTEGDVRYVTFTRVSGEQGGGGGYDKAIPTDAEQVRLDAAMNCLVRMPSSLLPREDQLLLIEIGGFLMARTEDNKVRALAAVDRWFEAWAAELDQELPTIWDDQDTPILGMAPIYTAGGGGGVEEDPLANRCPNCGAWSTTDVCQWCDWNADTGEFEEIDPRIAAALMSDVAKYDRARNVERIVLWIALVETVLGIPVVLFLLITVTLGILSNYQPAFDLLKIVMGGMSIGLVQRWFIQVTYRRVERFEALGGGGGDPLGLHRPRRIHAIYTPTPRPVRETEIAQDIQSMIEAGLLQPMVWGDPDQVTYVITPAGMDYLQMESGD